VPVAGGLKWPEKKLAVDPPPDELEESGPRFGRPEWGGRCQLGLIPEKLPDAVAKGDGGGSWYVTGNCTAVAE
jgi:hypothetical protein